jgi:hypothetical protein
MMRSVRRALTMATALPVAACALLAGAPAASATHLLPVSCDLAQSTQLLDGEVLGEYHYVWVQQVSSSETLVCIGAYPTNFVVQIKSGVSLTPPGVTNTGGAGSCATELFDLNAPVQIQMSVGATTAPTLCIGLDDETTTLGLTGVSVNTLPDVNIWRDANPSYAYAFCPVDYALWVADSSNYWGYYYCRTQADQIL